VHARRAARSIARLVAAAACGLFVFHGSSAGSLARADPPATEEVVPPRLLTPVKPGYPDGAEGDAFVVLSVNVSASGTVNEVRVLEGVEPFAARAVEAMSVARFVPATRAGIAIAVRVKFRVDFTKIERPAAEDPTATEAPTIEEGGDGPGAADGGAEPSPAAAAPGVDPRAASSPSSAPTPAAPPPPAEVLVRGGKSALGAGQAESLSRAEVRQLPGAFGDPFRALEVSTGLSPVISGLPYFYVRGAPPGNVGYMFDGVRVPYLFHFGLGPSVIPPALVARTDIHKGGYPAALGRYAGGIVEASALPPSTRFHGEGQLRAIDAGGLLEAPFANGRGAVMVGGRYAYTAGLFTLLQSDTSLDYRDYHARVSYALSDHDTVSLVVFGAYDLASQRTVADAESVRAASPPGTAVTGDRFVERLLFASEFHRVDTRWDHALGAGGNLRVAGTVGFDRTRLESRRSAEDLMTGLRLDVVQPVGKSVLLRGGADVVVDQYAADALPRFADDDDVVARQERIFASRTDFATGARLDAVIALGDQMEVTPGIRFDVYGSADARAVALDPRLAARFAVSRHVRLVHAYGLASQPPSTPLALPAITVARLEGGLQRSFQTSAGVEIDLPSDVTATATGFHNAFYELNDALGTAQFEIIDIEKSDSLLARTRGSAFGLELGLRRKLTQRLGGIVAYTLSRSTRALGDRTALSAYDRTHVLNVAASYDLGRSWRAGGRFVFYSGIPFAPAEPAFPGQVVGVPPERTPAFVRLDLRVEKRWKLGERSWVAVVFEALNATLSREVTGYRCGVDYQRPGGTPPPTCRARTIGPIAVPSIGLEGGF